MTALLIAAVLAIPAPHPDVQPCPKTFTRHMITRAIDTVYRGTRDVSATSRRHLRRYVRCARRHVSRRAMHRYWHDAWAGWKQRRATVVLSPLARCIMWAETGDRFYITVGQYQGVAMWSPDAWRIDGGYRYASTPNGATPQQQEAVLMWALDHGMAWEWVNFDPC